MMEIEFTKITNTIIRTRYDDDNDFVTVAIHHRCIRCESEISSVRRSAKKHYESVV